MDEQAFSLQAAFNVAFTLAGALGGVLLKGLRDDINRNRAALDDLPSTYARRDDLKSLGDELKATLARIEDKIDRKADK